MADFGDADPEDAYDEGDPPDVRWAVLRLWVASVALEAAKGDHDHVRVLARIQAARWAAGVLASYKLSRARRVALNALQVWLDELLVAEAP